MTASDESWLRRWVGGRRRGDAQDAQDAPTATQALPPSEEDPAARLQLIAQHNIELAEINGHLTHQLEQLEARLEAAAKDDKKAQFQELTAEFQAQQSSLRAARAAAEQASARVVDLQNKLNGLERDADTTRARAKAMKVANTGLHAQLGVLREQAGRTLKQLQFHQGQHEQERAQRKELEAEFDQANVRLTELAGHLTAANAELAEHKTRADRAQTELGELKQRCSGLEASLAEARAEVVRADARREQTLEHLFGPDGTHDVESLLRQHDAVSEPASAPKTKRRSGGAAPQ